MTCSVPGCDRALEVVAEALCQTHYKQKRAGRPFTKLRVYRDPHERDAEGRKFCSVCGAWRPVKDFARSSNRADGLQWSCRECRAAHYRSRADKVRDTMRLARFGLDRERFDAMLAAQGGGCAICGTTDPGTAYWHTDHDHSCCPGSEKTCGKCVRGILCRSCNQGLGNFRDDVERLKRASDYLAAWSLR